MTQMAPSVLLYGQAILLIKELSDLYLAGGVKDDLDMDKKIQEILSRFRTNAGYPITEWNPISETEPPVSVKMNTFWRQVQSDVALLQQQVDIVRASSIFTYNFISNDVEKATQQNAVLRNKIKTLQLYSDSVDSSIVVFSDSLNNSDFVDQTKTTAQSSANIDQSGGATLGQFGPYVNLAPRASVRILSDSNGFPGNNQEVKDPINAPILDPITGQKNLRFVAEEKRAASLRSIVDGSPSSWFEYEHWQIDDETRKICANYGLTYSVDNSGSENYYPAPGEGFVFSGAGGVSTKDWAGGPQNGTLNLDLELDLKTVQTLNQITYVPFDLADAVNLPVKIRYVEVSADGTVWNTVGEQNVWLSTDANVQAARIAPNIVTGKAVWRFQEAQVRYVRFHIQQPNWVKRPMGHIYWYNTRVPTQFTVPGQAFRQTRYAPSGVRVQGPTPYLPNIEDYYSPQNSTSGSLVSVREWFEEKRWSIGIRDISLEQIRYNTSSNLVTKPIRVGGIVDRVLIESELYIPPDFDPEVNWVRFFISPDDGVSWNEISRIQDSRSSTPEILAFNDPTPEAFREPGVGYVQTQTDVNSLRLKISISDPQGFASSTPVVKSYKLKIKRR